MSAVDSVRIWPPAGEDDEGVERTADEPVEVHADTEADDGEGAEDRAATHLDAIAHMYEEAMERIDHLSETWCPTERRRTVRVEAPDPFDPDVVTVDLSMHREQSMARSLSRPSDEANFVVEPELVESRNVIIDEPRFPDDRNVTIDEPVARAGRFGFWGAPLPNKRGTHRRNRP